MFTTAIRMIIQFIKTLEPLIPLTLATLEFKLYVVGDTGMKTGWVRCGREAGGAGRGGAGRIRVGLGGAGRRGFPLPVSGGVLWYTAP